LSLSAPDRQLGAVALGLILTFGGLGIKTLGSRDVQQEQLPSSRAKGAEIARLRFEQAGPSDASFAPFYVEASSRGRSTAPAVCVTRDTFDKLVSLLRRADQGVRSPYPPNTLRVTAFQGDSPIANYTIYPDAMLPVVIQLVQMLSDCRR